MNLVSIIVPMYNEEKNIESCIDVLKNQTNQNFDVVFINDGSIDNTLEKLKNYLSLSIQFNYKIIEQKNQGAAAARKKGIDQTLTNFIMILDCDDKISNNLIEEIYITHTKYNNVDIIIPNMHIQKKSGSWNQLKFYTQDCFLNSKECIKNSLGGWKVHGCFAIKKEIFLKSYSIYKKYNIKNENFINNDEVITRLNFLYSKIIIKIDANYYYCYNSLSTTKKINEKKYLMINNSIILNKIFEKDNEVSIKTKSELLSILWSINLYMYKHRSKIKKIDNWTNELKKALSHFNYFDVISTRLALKKKVQLIILKILYLF